MASQVGSYAKSDLLTTDENRIVEQMYAPKREVLAVTVAQLFHAAPNPRVWSKQQTGVVVLVKDHNQRSYFIQFVNLDTHSVTYSEEMYLELEYKSPYSYFHSFAGERCMVGINFCNDTEAHRFKGGVNGVAGRNKKRKEKIEQASRPPTSSATPMTAPPVSTIPESKASKNDKKNKKKSKKGKKGGISKADISGPSNFQHLSHLGWDKSKNQFDETQIDPALRDLLNTAGIKTNVLKDEGTAEFIKSFVDNYGGMETLKEKQRRSTIRSNSHGRGPPPAPPDAPGPPPPPSRGGPPPPPTRNMQAPPPVRNTRAPPPPTSRSAPRPPPTRAGPPAPRAPAAPQAPMAPKAPAVLAAPRAPVQPAAGRDIAQPPKPQGAHGNLLDEIRRGKELKAAASGGSGPAPAADKPPDLMSAIRGFGGAAGGLKSASPAKAAKTSGKKLSVGAARPPASPVAEPDDGLEGMAGALARALAGRVGALAASDDDSDEDTDDDWSD